jgi:transcriptional regulator with XRE-family HTH domain
MALEISQIVERMKRKSEAKTDSDLARILEITPQAISGFRKRGEIPSDLVIEFGRNFKVSLDWLIDGEGYPEIDRPPPSAMDIALPYGLIEGRISDLITKTVQILESETIYRTALTANINAFHQAINTEQEIIQIRKEAKQQQGEMELMKMRLIALEEKFIKPGADPAEAIIAGKEM